jgi:hypothetical protein
MIINFSRKGGFTGILIEIHLDSDTLSNDDEIWIKRKIEESNFFKLKGTRNNPPSGADRFVYNLKIVTETDQNQIEFTEESMPKGLEELVHYLINYARKR